MPKFTIAIPCALLAEAKRVAAKDRTSVNSLIRRLLEGHVRHSQAEMQGCLEGMMHRPALPAGQYSSEDIHRALFQDGLERTAAAGVLQHYSRGELPARDAMSAMGLHMLEDLYAAVVNAGLELPRGDQEVVERQASFAAQMIQGARLTITATELRRSFDLIIALLPTEGVIYVSYRGKVCAELMAPNTGGRPDLAGLISGITPRNMHGEISS